MHVLAVLCVAASSLVWAGHGDLPLSASDGEVASASHAHFDGSDLVQGCDHCCHAGAHLVALPAVVTGSAFAADRTYVTTDSLVLTQPQTDPPFIPPIA